MKKLVIIGTTLIGSTMLSRGPFVSAFLARDSRFGRAGYGRCPGRAAGDARQRRRCGAQKCTALDPKRTNAERAVTRAKSYRAWRGPVGSSRRFS